MVVDQTSGYSTWDEFRPLILDAYKAYIAVAGTSEVARLGLRYINDVTFEGMAEIRIEDWFNFYPPCWSRTTSKPRSIQQLCNFHVDSPENQFLRLQMNSIDPEAPDRISIRLDLDCFTQEPPANVDTDEMKECLESMHEKIDQIFEGSITEALRRRFNGEGNS